MAFLITIFLFTSLAFLYNFIFIRWMRGIKIDFRIRKNNMITTRSYLTILALILIVGIFFWRLYRRNVSIDVSLGNLIKQVLPILDFCDSFSIPYGNIILLLPIIILLFLCIIRPITLIYIYLRGILLSLHVYVIGQNGKYSDFIAFFCRHFRNSKTIRPSLWGYLYHISPRCPPKLRVFIRLGLFITGNARVFDFGQLRKFIVFILPLSAVFYDVFYYSKIFHLYQILPWLYLYLVFEKFFYFALGEFGINNNKLLAYLLHGALYQSDCSSAKLNLYSLRLINDTQAYYKTQEYKDSFAFLYKKAAGTKEKSKFSRFLARFLPMVTLFLFTYILYNVLNTDFGGVWRIIFINSIILVFFLGRVYYLLEDNDVFYNFQAKNPILIAVKDKISLWESYFYKNIEAVILDEFTEYSSDVKLRIIALLKALQKIFPSRKGTVLMFLVDLLPQLMVLICFIVDVFWFGEFHYVYYGGVLLLLPLLFTIFKKTIKYFIHKNLPMFVYALASQPCTIVGLEEYDEICFAKETIPSYCRDIDDFVDNFMIPIHDIHYLHLCFQSIVYKYHFYKIKFFIYVIYIIGWLKILLFGILI